MREGIRIWVARIVGLSSGLSFVFLTEKGPHLRLLAITGFMAATALGLIYWRARASAKNRTVKNETLL